VARGTGETLMYSQIIPVDHNFGDKNTPFDFKTTVVMNQIHSDIIKYVTESDVGTIIEQCDALVTGRSDVTISVKTADCVPLLMYGGGIIAAVHAGWRGTIKLIAPKTVKFMADLGVHISDIKIAVGPCICYDCYEVKDDFRQAVRGAVGSEYCDMFVRDYSGTGSLHADITALNIKLLTDCGIKPANIENLNICTCCNKDVYFSYRGSGGAKDVNRNVIRL
jgi:YfiH family protein